MSKDHKKLSAILATVIATGTVAGAVLFTGSPGTALTPDKILRALSLGFGDSLTHKDPNRDPAADSTAPTHGQTRIDASPDTGRKIFSSTTARNGPSTGSAANGSRIDSDMVAARLPGRGKSGLAKAGTSSSTTVSGADGHSIGASASGRTSIVGSAGGTASTNSGALTQTEREATPSAPAASATWLGTTNSTWATASNWTAGGPPGSGDTATFNNLGNGNTTLDLGAGVTVLQILFDTSSAAAYTIGSGAVGSQTLTLNASGAITVNSTVINSQTINANLVLGANSTLTNNSTTPGQLLTIAGTVSTSTTVALAGSGNGTISGIISGNGALTKSGTGTWRLSGANNYSGATTVTGGTLLINGTQPASGAVNVTGSGTTLGGTGTIATGGGTRVTVNAGANIAPGNGGNTTGILTVRQLTLQPNSNFLVDINGTTVGTGYDQLVVAAGGGSAAVITGSNLVVTVGATLTIGNQFTILTRTAAGGVTGQFAQGNTVIASNGNIFSITYNAPAGDVILTFIEVPEPGTWIGGALAFAAIGYIKRRRLRKLIVRS